MVNGDGLARAFSQRLIVGKATPSLAADFSWVSPVRSRSSQTSWVMCAWALNAHFHLGPTGTCTNQDSRHGTLRIIYHTVIAHNIKRFCVGRNSCAFTGARGQTLHSYIFVEALLGKDSSTGPQKGEYLIPSLAWKAPLRARRTLLYF